MLCDIQREVFKHYLKAIYSVFVLQFVYYDGKLSLDENLFSMFRNGVLKKYLL